MLWESRDWRSTINAEGAVPRSRTLEPCPQPRELFRPLSFISAIPGYRARVKGVPQNGILWRRIFGALGDPFAALSSSKNAGWALVVAAPGVRGGPEPARVSLLHVDCYRLVECDKGGRASGSWLSTRRFTCSPARRDPSAARRMRWLQGCPPVREKDNPLVRLKAWFMLASVVLGGYDS